MKKIIVFSFLCFLFANQIKGCDCDTIYVVLKKRTDLLKNWWGPDPSGFINCNTIIEYSNRHRQINYNQYKGPICNTLGAYYIIYDIKGRVTGEGIHNGETFSRYFTLYYKNGRKKLVGYFDSEGGRAKEWIYYDKKGKIKKKVSYQSTAPLW